MNITRASSAVVAGMMLFRSVAAGSYPRPPAGFTHHDDCVSRCTTTFDYLPSGQDESVTCNYTMPNLGISPIRPRPPIIQRLFYFLL